MKTNVNYLHKDFYINPDKRKVFCKLTYSIDLDNIPGINMFINNPEFIKYLDDITDPYTGIAKFDDSTVNCGTLIFNTTGIASCSTEDEFDVSIGKQLALTRAQRSAFNITKNIYSDLFAILMHAVYRIDNLINATEVSANNCKNHEYELTKYNNED